MTTEIVTIDGTDYEVTLDDDGEVESFEKTADALKGDTFEDVEKRNFDNTVGVGTLKFDNWKRAVEKQDGLDYGSVLVTTDYLKQFAEQAEEEFGDCIRVYVADEMPVFAVPHGIDLFSNPDAVTLAPRVRDEY